MWDTILTQIDWVVFAVMIVVTLIVVAFNRQRLIDYVKEVRQEWTRVSTPSREESVAHTSVVLTGVLISAAFLFVVDWVLQNLMKVFYNL
ncbi:MAG: preprotein translocase subunit SecE [Candidatus Poribacteria bacterium]|nr:preprotein translocase subunit SecE [Candidatus Poribacteria bacterium]